MVDFDLNKEDFKTLVENSQKPAIVQLMTKVDSICSPLQLYATLQNAGHSYLLESVEKEKRHARYSFVGYEPEMVVAIKDRYITIECQMNSELTKHIYNKLKAMGDVESLIGGKFRVKVNEGDDALAAFRKIYPTSTGTQMLNQKRFDRQTFLGGAIGYNSYDLVYDSWLDRDKKPDADVPDMHFAIMSKTFVFDHITNETYIVITPFVTESSDLNDVYEHAVSEAQLMERSLQMASVISISEDIPAADTEEPVANMDQAAYEEAVRIAKHHIIDGDIFQVVPSRRYTVKMKQTPLQLYIRLRNINPSPYMYIFNFKDIGIVGASPETLMTVFDRKVITNPIAGTCPRGNNDEEDRELAQEMLNDKKERAEHVMLVDLGRNDVRMVSKGGTVKVDDLMSVVKYSHLQHIESTVSGELRDECDQFDATRAIFPAGTLSGAPKIRAMEIIDDLEPESRGIYGGGVGYYSWNGDADFAIVIRTVLIKNNTAYVQAGAGIVADSDPTYEYKETERKMAAMIKAIGGKQ
ncbi:anthranilate synthase component I [Methanolobus sediminis]|uniref:Anthranilate synthase component 1 n=1 Tax=Methanolobus sediminis TaxID=3072978 RepID=A0AA51UIC1_9EURY|nr:anthranilate synthase component I [Methanolobus sediminis]WMW24066.1 anthranilate synthase component I [Methanolobus sediminis]